MYSASLSINTYALNNQLFMTVLSLEPKNSLKITKYCFFSIFKQKIVHAAVFILKNPDNV